MTRERTLGVAAAPQIAGDQTRLAMLRDCAVLNFSIDPVFDRWTRSLRRNTAAAVGALCLADGQLRLVKSASTVAGSAGQVTELAAAESLETYLLGLAHAVGPAGSERRFANAPVTIGEQVLGQVAMADWGRSAWTAQDLEALHDTAVAVSTELALRLAKKKAERVQQVVSSHNKVHDMIAQAAPLRDVLFEVCESIERYDPSLVSSVLLLDSASSTLHSGVGPSLPPEYLTAIDGVVIGPNVGTCGPAAWFGQLTISPNLAEDPNWAPMRELVRAANVAHCWSMPIKAAGGDVLGTLAFYGRQPPRAAP
jgi:GAF domain-containing protein